VCSAFSLLLMAPDNLISPVETFHSVGKLRTMIYTQLQCEKAFPILDWAARPE
jgi:hypothetical protein